MFPLYPLCWEFFFFIINRCWILSKTYSTSIEIIMWFLFFNLLMWCITVIGFADIEPSCHPWDKSHWIMVYDPFDVPLNLLCYCFFEDFCIYVHQRYWPVILFFCDIFVWFWYQGDAGLVEWVQKCFFRASLVAQWLRICLPMQGTRVRALVWEDPTCRGATRPVSHKCWACASGACAPQQERPW